MSPIIVGPDPDYYQNISRRWGNALTAMTEVLAQKRAKEDRDLQRNLELLTRNPELADTLGADMVKKYGRKRPEIVSLVSTLQEQKRLQKEAETNYNKYERAYTKEIADREAFQANLANMPDELPFAVDPWTSIPVPNVTKQTAMAQTAMLPDPRWSAYAKMSPEDRYAATVAMRHLQEDIPTPPKNLGPQDLSDAMQGLMASGYAPWSPEGQTTAKSQAGLQLSPEEQEKARLEQEKNKRELQERLDQEKRTSEEQRALIKEREQSQMRLTDYREGKKSPSEKLSPEEKKQADKLDKQIESNLRPRLAGTPERKALRPSKAEEAKAKRDGKSVPTPPPSLTRYAADQVKEMVTEKIRVRGGDPDTTTAKTLQAYDELLAKGMKPNDALDKLREMLDAAIARD